MPDAIFGQWAEWVLMEGGQELVLDAKLFKFRLRTNGGRRHWRSQWHMALII
jgi:hypothetical protein